ncbi:hypothetical protein CWI75_18110 [Kineobactrum sediminis]|uniref:Uncharacterized protein n=1 Tax=Kineobactrum sediminis TaxID=1905677 RepID=A0A2N5XXS2_9GAMM|nr:biotin carboxylase N-terminal domain-containing protein [Kineobactrum sediminis]PLW80955.1 hypothetical protein CWI75_18110 [Kineobactrum sediminis]
MSIQKLLVANRGEIAIRVMRAAHDAGIISVAVSAEDEDRALHVRHADEHRALAGKGARAYLDADAMVRAALDAGADAVHPGYGFLSENASFARKCQEAGLTFVGPRPEILEYFGDKVTARRIAANAGVAVLSGTEGNADVNSARAFLASLPAGSQMIIKAVAGGGGRGVRVVDAGMDLEDAMARAAAEARAAFGDGALYIERYLPNARHIEVQVVGDGSGRIAHLGERDCSIQRRYQKIIEIAPSPLLADSTRRQILDAAIRVAESVKYDSIGTLEFLVSADGQEFAFIEANARLQVEHTITEEVMGVDLVRIQLELAQGASIESLAIPDEATAKGFAIQLRINTERMKADGRTLPAGGELKAFDLPGGPGVRVDTLAFNGFRSSPGFDSLLAKLVVHSPSANFSDCIKKALRSLSEFQIDGIETNREFLANIMRHPDFASGNIHTRFVDEHLAVLADIIQKMPKRYVEPVSERRIVAQGLQA